HVPERRQIELQHTAVAHHARGEIRTLPGEEIQLAEEARRPVPGDDDVDTVVFTDDLDFTLEDGEEAGNLVAGAVQGLTAGDRALMAVLRELGEHRLVQFGECSIAASDIGHRAVAPVTSSGHFAGSGCSGGPSTEQ